MATDLALNSESTATTLDDLRTRLDAIPDDVKPPHDEAMAATAQPMASAPLMEPWEAVNVAWVMPFAGMLLKLPYEQAAKVTKDDCWRITDDQIAIINPAMERAVQWTVWKLGAASAVSHPLVAFGVALGSLTAVKYGVYQYNQHQQKEGAPSRSQQQQQQLRQDGSLRPTHTASSTTNGRTEESEGASSFVANPGAGNRTSLKREFVVVEE